MFKNLKLCVFAAVILAAAPLSAAHADSATYATLHASEPAIAPGDGRFYFYRDDSFIGFALQPTIMIDGESSGERSKPGDYFYVDRPAGTYEISTETEKKEAVTATLASGQSLYIRFDVSMGLFLGHVIPSIIDPQQALNEIKDCDYRAPNPVPATTAPATSSTTPAAPATTAPVTTAPATAAPAAAAPAAAETSSATPAPAASATPAATPSAPAATAPADASTSSNTASTATPAATATGATTAASSPAAATPAASTNAAAPAASSVPAGNSPATTSAGSTPTEPAKPTPSN